MEIRGRISEIFESVQGEGLYFGERQLFIRFFGCNLDCIYCDTRLKHYREYRLKELITKLGSFRNDYHSLAFTGGEPLLQNDFLKEVLSFTSSIGAKTYLETNGTLYRELGEVIDKVDIIAMDLKLPSSTLNEGCWKAHRQFLRIALQKETFLKCVICQSTTDADMKKVIGLLEETAKYLVVVLQPNSLEDTLQIRLKTRRFKNMLKKAEVASCVIPQMHKVWGIP